MPAKLVHEIRVEGQHEITPWFRVPGSTTEDTEPEVREWSYRSGLHP